MRKKNSNIIQDSWKWTKDIEREKPKLSTFGTKRVNMILGIGYSDYSPSDDKEIEFIRSGRYGVGSKRTLSQAVEFTGIDLKNRKMKENKCGNLIWVPYEESDHYGLEEHYHRGLAGGVAEVEDEVKVIPNVVVPPGNSAHIPGAWKEKAMNLRKRLPSKQNEEGSKFFYLSLCAVILLVVFLGKRLFGGRRRKNERHKN